MNNLRFLYSAILIALVLLCYAEGSCYDSKSCKQCVKDVNCIWCQPKNGSVSNETNICISGTFFNGPSEGKDYCSHYKWGQCTIDGMLMKAYYTYIILAAIGILILIIIIIILIVLCCKYCPFDDNDDSNDTELQKSTSASSKLSKSDSSSSTKKESEYDRRRREMLAKADSGSSSSGTLRDVKPDEIEIVAPIKVEIIQDPPEEEKPETPPETPSSRSVYPTRGYVPPEENDSVEVRVYRIPSSVVVSATGSIREEAEEDKPDTPPQSRNNSRHFRPRTPVESETEPEPLADDDREPTLRMSPMPSFNRATQDFGDIEATFASLQRDIERANS